MHLLQFSNSSCGNARLGCHFLGVGVCFDPHDYEQNRNNSESLDHLIWFSWAQFIIMWYRPGDVLQLACDTVAFGDRRHYLLGWCEGAGCSKITANLHFHTAWDVAKTEGMFQVSGPKLETQMNSMTSDVDMNLPISLFFRSVCFGFSRRLRTCNRINGMLHAG